MPPCRCLPEPWRRRACKGWSCELHGKGGVLRRGYSCWVDGVSKAVAVIGWAGLCGLATDCALHVPVLCLTNIGRNTEVLLWVAPGRGVCGAVPWYR